MTTAAWASYLDSLESELHAVQRTPHGRARLGVFVPPDGLGPLPAAYAERARTLLGQLESEASAVREDMHRVNQQMKELRELNPRGPRPPSTFDSHA